MIEPGIRLFFFNKLTTADCLTALPALRCPLAVAPRIRAAHEGLVCDLIQDSLLFPRDLASSDDKVLRVLRYINEEDAVQLKVSDPFASQSL